MVAGLWGHLTLLIFLFKILVRAIIIVGVSWNYIANLEKRGFSFFQATASVYLFLLVWECYKLGGQDKGIFLWFMFSLNKGGFSRVGLVTKKALQMEPDSSLVSKEAAKRTR